MKLGKYFKTTRRSTGLVQIEMCKKLKITQGGLSKLENDIQMPKADTLIRLLQYCKEVGTLNLVLGEILK